MKFFAWAMRSAAAILFVMSLLIVAGTIGYHFYIYVETSRSIASGQMTMSPPLSASQFLLSTLTGLGSAAFPFFGAAIVWRLDLWLARRAEGRAAE